MKRIIVFILAMLMLITSCATVVKQEETKAATLPEKPEELPVSFRDLPSEGGLLLLYDEYRKLEINILNMRYYEECLEAMILGDSPLVYKEVI